MSILDRFRLDGNRLFITGGSRGLGREMALAIAELRPKDGPPVEGEIGIWGVEMEHGTEYREQRVGFRHFIDLAKEIGIPVTRLVSGGLAYEPVPSPFWQDDPLLSKLAKRTQETT